MPEVSVIIPNYNHAAFLESRIASVLAQTYTDFEVILLDDCSSDNSVEIIEKYRHQERVAQIVYNTSNSGSPFVQWGKGVELARGNYIWIAESDDEADPDFLRHTIAALLADERMAMAYTQSLDMDENGTVAGSRIEWTSEFIPNRWRENFVMEGDEFIREFLLHKNVIPNASAVVFSRALFLQRWDSSVLQMKMLGDWMLWISLLRGQRIGFVATPLNRFRLHSSVSRIHSSRERKRLRIREEANVIEHISKQKLSAVSLRAARQRIMQKWVLQFSPLKAIFEREFYSVLTDLPVNRVTLITTFIRCWLRIGFRKIKR